MHDDSPSPLLRTLRQAVRAQVPAAEAEFWLRVGRTGAPLVEPDPEGDPDHRLVTFLWRDDPERPATDVLTLLHTVTDKDRHAGDLTGHLMRRVDGTSAWAISHRLRADHRASYQFVTGHGTRADLLRTDRASWVATLDAAVPDPLNPAPALPAREGRSPASVLSLPDAPPQPHTARRPGVPRGRAVTADVEGRKVTAHLPPGHTPEGGPYAVAVLLDGEMWGPVLGVGDTLDNLHADGALPPTVALLVDTMSRRPKDLSCSGEFVDWLADVLLPWAALRFAVAPRPERTVVAGQSAGGLTAAFAVHRRPERFGLALSQSGSFWWSDDEEIGAEWLTRRYAATPPRDVRLHLEVGVQEWMLLAENRRFHDVLQERGYAVSYEEFNGGHDYACWRGGLASGLTRLLA
ncbi:enterochelin esterase [Streptomyces sp. p1417]|uniref:Enterochelin esterase n=1 Tax=Streptomyces typhae TaxID=2681492 RepID=A0A6L6WV33_9ACTN|nr:enterochelin esterase [Streptomyces typhae]MVO85577.1 enterochelin esterase [Streptomyces typhae]